VAIDVDGSAALESKGVCGAGRPSGGTKDPVENHLQRSARPVIAPVRAGIIAPLS
jgi:hypothetical protein